MSRGVWIKTLGCKVNQVESRDIADSLIGSGIPLVDSPEHASLAVINTCTVTARSDAKVRKEIRRALKVSSMECVIATGCSAVVSADMLTHIDTRVRVEPDKSRVADLVRALFENESTTLPVLPIGLDRTRANLKISDGCENCCSFCIVPIARGPESHVDVKHVIAKARKLVESGTHEIVLTGINIGSYFICDADWGAVDLARLIELLREETDIYRVRVSSIEPPWVTDAFVTVIKDTDIVCEHLHIPLQSGSDRVLADMNRYYTTAQYRTMVENLRSACAHLALHTDVIVGFPTETDEDFEDTVRFAEEIGFAGMHLFKYSTRAGTAAASLSPLPPQLVEERFQRLRQVALRCARTYKDRRLSSEVALELIIERIDGGQVKATSREHLTFSWDRRNCPFPQVRVGDIVRYREGGDNERLDCE